MVMSDATPQGLTREGSGPIEEANGLHEFIDHIRSDLDARGAELPARFELRLGIDVAEGEFTWRLPMDTLKLGTPLRILLANSPPARSGALAAVAEALEQCTSEPRLRRNR
jgi:hypothetical protein